MKTKIVSMIIWGLLAIYAFFAYHLLLIPAFLEYSIYGIVIGWGILFILFFLIRKEKRRQVTIFLLLVIFSTKAFYETSALNTLVSFILIAAISFVVWLVAKYYGKLANHIILSLIIVAIAINFFVPRNELRMYNHFAKIWESPTLYYGESVDYFPLFTLDIDDDGKKEIITFGNYEEIHDSLLERKERLLNPGHMPFDLENERVYVYAYKWNGSEMERIDLDRDTIEKLRPHFPKDYIGFPYYVWNDDFTLVPETSRQQLAEKTGQFGAMPFYVMDLNINAMKQYADIFQGVSDIQNQFRFDTDISAVIIENGQLIVEKDEGTITQPTTATKIVDLIRTKDGLGIVLLSDKLEIWTFADENKLILTHSLTEKEIKNIMSSEFIVADIDNDGTDEILISATTSRIIRPAVQGKWEILFTSRDESLRFEDFATIGNDEKETIISLSKSKIRNQPLRFLTGFTYSDEGLVQEWKSFVSLINVHAVDVTGDSENELVATVWGSHKIYVFKKHGLPVYATLITIFALLVLYTVYRRVKPN